MLTVTEDCSPIPISDLEPHGLSVRSINLLEEKLGCVFLNDLRNLVPESINVRGISVKVWNEVRSSLSSFLESVPITGQSQIDQRVEDHRQKELLHAKYRDLAVCLRQSVGRKMTYYRHEWWPDDKKLLRAAANGLIELLDENERLWDELLKGRRS